MDKAHMVQRIFPRCSSHRGIPRAGAAAAALATMLVASGHAHAMDPDIGTAAETCEFPTTVSIKQNCTGVYVGNGVVLTAGHCARKWAHLKHAGALLGESKDEGWVLSLPFEHLGDEGGYRCVAHPDGNWHGDSYLGPDIGYCILEEDPLVMHKVPPMIPSGCERDWLVEELSHNVYGVPVTAVGMGSCSFNEYANCERTTKRHAVETLTGQVRYADSDTKLALNRDLWEGDPGLRPGDSGGPVFVRLPDDTWRLLGLATHANSVIAYAEAIPPYLHWIESSSGRDITPGHEFIGGSWVAVEEDVAGLSAAPGPYGHWNQVAESGHACLAHPAKLLYSYVQEPLLGGMQCTGWPAEGPDDLATSTIDPPDAPAPGLFEPGWTPATGRPNPTFDLGLTIDTTTPVEFLPVKRSSTREPVAGPIANMAR